MTIITICLGAFCLPMLWACVTCGTSNAGQRIQDVESVEDALKGADGKE